MDDPLLVIDHDDFVLKQFEEHKELAFEMIGQCIQDYKDGDKSEMEFIKLNLYRYVVAHGYVGFEKAGLERKAIDDVLQHPNLIPKEKAIINQMLKVLDIKEQI